MGEYGQEEMERAMKESIGPQTYGPTLDPTPALLQQIADLRARLNQVDKDRVAQMTKWQDDRQELMRATPGYVYKNRVDDPEWDKAKTIIIQAEARARRLEEALRDAQETCEYACDTKTNDEWCLLCKTVEAALNPPSGEHDGAAQQGLAASERSAASAPRDSGRRARTVEAVSALRSPRASRTDGAEMPVPTQEEAAFGGEAMNQLDATKARAGFEKWAESKSAGTTRDRLKDALWGAYLYGYLAGMKAAATEEKPPSHSPAVAVPLPSPGAQPGAGSESTGPGCEKPHS